MTTPIPRKAFYFLRHGQTEHNVKRITTGREKDVPLNDHGRSQARLIAPQVEQLPIQTICYSPLRRAQETMELGAAGLTTMKRIAIDDLKECVSDVWLTMTEQKAKEPSCAQVRAFFAQVRAGLLKALTFAGPVLIIAHGGVYWALCHQLKIFDHEWKIGNGEVAHFSPNEDNGWQAKLIIEPPKGG
ncbi:MAG: phosphoglycerate mutase family protein [Chlamydiota bacterium]